MKYLFLFVAMGVLPVVAQQKKPVIYYPSPGNWEHRPAGTVGMDAVLLREAIAFAQAHESKEPRDLKKAHYQSSFGREPFGYPVGPLKERGPVTGLIIKNGYIVAEWGEPGRVDQTFSVAKSFLSSVAGLAFDAGLITSVDDKVFTYMAPIIPYEPGRLAADRSDALVHKDVIDLFDTDHNRTIAWDHLLRQTSDWEGTLCTPTPVQPTYDFMNFYLNTDKKLYASAPATAFAHIGAGPNIIYVDPENDLIIVARWIEGNSMNELIEKVLKCLN
jgi:CubicO group peptidase (beta-lactamase class C family)